MPREIKHAWVTDKNGVRTFEVIETIEATDLDGERHERVELVKDTARAMLAEADLEPTNVLADIKRTARRIIADLDDAETMAELEAVDITTPFENERATHGLTRGRGTPGVRPTRARRPNQGGGPPK